MLTLAHDSTQERTYQAMVLRDAQRDAAAKRIRNEIQAAMLIGLAGQPGVTVPYVQRSALHGRDRVQHQPFAEALLDTLDEAVPLEALLKVLAESTDPLVAELRVALARKCADVRAREIAEFEASRPV